MPSPVEQFTQLQRNSNFVFLVFYRGHWCPFCLNYLKSFRAIGPAIKQAGGEPIIATAETGQENLAEVREKTGFKATAIIDPEHELANELKKYGVEVAITPKSGYANGVAQPAIIVIDKTDKVIYTWAIKPSVMNLGGAKDRPSLQEIWEDVQAELAGKKTVHGGKYSKQTFFQGISTKIFG